jgi:hypothetical protein
MRQADIASKAAFTAWRASTRTTRKTASKLLRRWLRLPGRWDGRSKSWDVTRAQLQSITKMQIQVMDHPKVQEPTSNWQRSTTSPTINGPQLGIRKTSIGFHRITDENHAAD